MTIKINTLTTDIFLELYTSVGWKPPCREQVECALKNTAASFVAYEEEKAIGMVRLIGDGGMSFYIKDFAILPGYQGKGVGQMLLMELQQYLLEHKPADWAVSLELISTKGAVEFYKKHGFEERPCEWDVTQGPGDLGLRGPKRSVDLGMFKMIRNSEGITVDYATDSGKLKTQQEYEKIGDLYKVGKGCADLMVQSSSGDLKIE